MKKDAAYFASLRWYDTKLRVYDGRELDGIRIVATSSSWGGKNEKRT